MCVPPFLVSFPLVFLYCLPLLRQLGTSAALEVASSYATDTTKFQYMQRPHHRCQPPYISFSTVARPGVHQFYGLPLSALAFPLVLRALSQCSASLSTKLLLELQTYFHLHIRGYFLFSFCSTLL